MIELIDIFDYPEVEKEALDKQKEYHILLFPKSLKKKSVSK